MPGMPIKRTMSWNENFVSTSPIVGLNGRGVEVFRGVVWREALQRIRFEGHWDGI